MGCLGILLGLIATFMFWTKGHYVLMSVTITDTLVCLWSYGVMHNYATEAAKRRQNFTGGFYDITQEEAQAAPDWLALLNLLTTLAAIALLITSIVIRVWF